MPDAGERGYRVYLKSINFYGRFLKGKQSVLNNTTDKMDPPSKSERNKNKSCRIQRTVFGVNFHLAQLTVDMALTGSQS